MDIPVPQIYKDAPSLNQPIRGGGNSNMCYFHPEPWGRFPPIFDLTTTLARKKKVAFWKGSSLSERARLVKYFHLAGYLDVPLEVRINGE